MVPITYSYVKSSSEIPAATAPASEIPIRWVYIADDDDDDDDDDDGDDDDCDGDDEMIFLSHVSFVVQWYIAKVL